MQKAERVYREAKELAEADGTITDAESADLAEKHEALTTADADYNNEVSGYLDDHNKEIEALNSYMTDHPGFHSTAATQLTNPADPENFPDPDLPTDSDYHSRFLEGDTTDHVATTHATLGDSILGSVTNAALLTVIANAVGSTSRLVRHYSPEAASCWIKNNACIGKLQSIGNGISKVIQGPGSLATACLDSASATAKIASRATNVLVWSTVITTIQTLSAEEDSSNDSTPKINQHPRHQ